MSDQILHAIWRSEVHHSHIHHNRDGSLSVNYGPSINFGTNVTLDKIRSRIKWHHNALVAALAIERMLDRGVDEMDERIDKIASAFYKHSAIDGRPWFEIEEDDPQLAESFRRIADLAIDLHKDGEVNDDR